MKWPACFFRGEESQELKLSFVVLLRRDKITLSLVHVTIESVFFLYRLLQFD